MAVFDYEQVKNPEFFKDNVLKAHALCTIYANKNEVSSGSSLIASMDGVWKFNYAKNIDCAINGFESLDYDCDSWNSIRVPAHIQLEGYDVPQYSNIPYPWDGRDEVDPGQIPSHFNPVAQYVKYFTVPQHMKGKKIHMCFDGVESGFVLWINGKYVGYSEDSFTTSEFDITSFLIDGENKVALNVFKWTSSSWCEDQDFFRFSGIYRSVYLVAIPEVHLEDLFVKTLFEDDDFSKSNLQVEYTVQGEGKIEYELKYDGSVIKTWYCDANDNDVINVAIDNPMLWSAENPVLYDLEITLINKNGVACEFVNQKVGFRKFELKNNRMLINGKRIVFKGANRHDFSSISGRCVSYEEVEKDIITMKRNNINAIRTSHYPNDEKLYDLCDKYGLYMIAENNLETHGSWDSYKWRKNSDESYLLPDGKPEWKEMMFDRIRSTFNRDKNHPAIIIWSCGNEAFGGDTIYEMSELFRSLDDTRLVHYEGIFNDRRRNETSDMESRMYAKVWDIEEYLEKDGSKPFIQCEYTHAMGNSCGAMHKYTELADKPGSGYQGGFIWDYIDQSIYKKDRYGKWFLGYGGDFHDRPCDYNFSGNGIAYGGERNESPKMQEVKFNYQNIAITVNANGFEVWNKHLFTNTDEYVCKAELLRDGVVVDKKSLGAVSVEPESKKTFDLPFDIPVIFGEYVVTISFVLKEDKLFADAGYEVAFGQGVIAKVEGTVEVPEITGHAKMKVIHGKYNYGVRVGDYEYLFGTMTHGLVSFRNAGVEMIEAIPKPNFWRAPTDNDDGNNMVGNCGQWKLASMYCTTRGIGNNPLVEETKDSFAITYYYNLQTSPKAQCALKYEVLSDGSLKTTLSFDPASVEAAGVDEPWKLLGDMPEFGVMLKLDADFDIIEWYGNGPRESYADRKHGAKLGIYRQKVADQLAQYLVPQESGNKTDVKYAKVVDMKGRGIMFTGDNMNFSALPYTPHEIENAKHHYELPEVHYTVVRVSMAQMGIGGDDSWGAPVHDEYHIHPNKKMQFSFIMKGI